MASVHEPCEGSRHFIENGCIVDSGGVPLSVVHPCLHGAVRHCQIQNNLVIRSKNGVAIVHCGQHKILFYKQLWSFRTISKQIWKIYLIIEYDIRNVLLYLMFSR